MMKGKEKEEEKGQEQNRGQGDTFFPLESSNKSTRDIFPSKVCIAPVCMLRPRSQGDPTVFVEQTEG